jgi:hypothetical protein
VIRAGVVVAAVAVVVQTAVQLANRAWLHTPRLNADVDESALTWLSAGATAVAAVAVLALAFVSLRRVRLIVLAAVLVVFVVDDVLALHEQASLKVSATLGLDLTYTRAIWPLLYLPALAFAFIALWQLAGRAVSVAGLAIRRGLVTLVGAIALEVLWTVWHQGPGSIGDWPDTVEVAVEEGLELAAWIVIASGLTAEALARIVPYRRKAAAAPPPPPPLYRIRGSH